MTTASLSCQLLHSSTFLLLYIFYAQLFIPDMKITNWIESCEVKTGGRERYLKGSWAVKWRRWWQGEGNLLEDKQKKGDSNEDEGWKVQKEKRRQREMRTVQRGRLDRGHRATIGCEIQCISPVSCFSGTVWDAEQKLWKGNRVLGILLVSIRASETTRCCFFVLWYSIDPWRRSTAFVWDLSAGRRGSAPDQQQLVKDSLTCSRTLRQGEGSL